MNYWIDLISAFLGGAFSLLTLIGLGMAFVMPGINKWNKRFFIAYFIVQLLCIASYVADTAVCFNPAPVWTAKAILVPEFLFNLAMMLMPSVLLLHCCGEDVRKSLLFRVNSVLTAIFIILLICAQFTDKIYSFDPTNKYIIGPLGPVLYAPLEIILIVNLAAALRRRGRMPRKYFAGFLLCFIPMTIAMGIHMFFDAINLIYIATILNGLAIFGIIISDQIEQYMRQQRKIAHQQAGLLVLQMRPHFILNTITSIYYLCESDPKKAQQVTLDFSSYLRKNLNAIVSGETIPFTEELEHTRAYLAVEQASYTNRLFVGFDTPHTVFRVPPLTLQPLVENAVKHGMDPDGDPLHILIRTRSTDAGSEIIVENSGSDFKQTDDNEPHLALSNIRQRLNMMCGGTLTIAPREGGGTVATVTIPNEEEPPT